jgi:hypothetical protein
LYSPIIVNSPSNSPRKIRKLLNYPPFCKFIQVLFNYFNLCEIIRHFGWSPGLIRGPDQKKLKIFQLFIIRPATSPDQSEPKISTDDACANFVLIRSAAYYPEWKLAFKVIFVSVLRRPFHWANEQLSGKHWYNLELINNGSSWGILVTGWSCRCLRLNPNH